jgi:hypothetical protein
VSHADREVTIMSSGTTPPEQEPTDQSRVDRLIRMAVELTGEVETLPHDIGTHFVSLASSTRRNRLMIWALAGSMFLDVIITVVLVFVGAATVKNTDRLNQVTSDLSATQTEQRTRALCPLYGVLKGAESPEGKARSALPPDEYDHAFEVINEGYLTLKCDEFLEDSGRGSW